MKYMIPDIKHYVKEMSKAMQDKLWFLNYVWVDTMVDIGTADAAIPQYILDNINPNLLATCFEPSPHLSWEAQQKTKGDNFHVRIYDKFNDFLTATRRLDNDLCLLSSVLHEVYSNNEFVPLEDVFNAVRVADAEYVAIRDMYLPNSNITTPQDISQAIIAFVEKNPEERGRFDQYNAKFPISNGKNAIQYLLKYRYKVNWEHEMCEDYFSINMWEVKRVMRLYGYEVMHERKFVPEFIANDIKFNFGVELPTTTHIEIIFKKTI